MITNQYPKIYHILATLEIPFFLYYTTITNNEKMEKMRKVIFDLASPELKKLLVRKLIDIKAKGSYGRTALMFAIMDNNTELAKILIDEGSDVNARDDDGQTPLMYTTEYNDPVIAKSLIAAGADVNAKDDDGRTALIWTVGFNRNLEIIKELITSGAKIDSKDKKLIAFLRLAADIGRDPKVGKVLAAAGDSDVDTQEVCA